MIDWHLTNLAKQADVLKCKDKLPKLLLEYLWNKLFTKKHSKQIPIYLSKFDTTSMYVKLSQTFHVFEKHRVVLTSISEIIFIQKI